ncbi:MAG TPA: DUF6249 domain-containing protein [Steroidobacteraceae bacterium]|nr:DUF6249 domain-containing protein [Steroidobacteraceae bacterium]
MTGDIAVLIPVVAIIMGVGIGMLGLTLNYRRKREMFQLHHAERLAAIEKGIELPPLPKEFFESERGSPGPRHYTYLRRGVMLLLLGIVLFVALHAEAGPDEAWWGLIPSVVGVADLMYYFLARGKVETLGPQSGPQNGASPGPSGPMPGPGPTQTPR